MIARIGEKIDLSRIRELGNYTAGWALRPVFAVSAAFDGAEVEYFGPRASPSKL